jgi:PRTRC genetic system protein B
LFRLRACLLVYELSAEAALVQRADISTDADGTPRIASASPLTREGLGALLRGVHGLAPTRVVLPEGVVTWDGARLAWRTPARRRRIWFSGKQQPQLQHVSRKEVWHPPLLWVADAGRLHLWAWDGNWRGAETPLFQAPYLNIYADGSVCGGAIQWPKTTEPDAIPAWETAWFDSEGTHCTAPELTRFPGGHDRLWEAMLAAECFPIWTLVPVQKTVLDAVNWTGEPMGGPAVREIIVPDRPALEGAIHA